MLFLIECKISVKASPTTWTVDDDGPAEFHTIQEAINNATSGDTIFVRAGTYYEHLIVNKSVSLVGEDRDLTIIDGEGIDSVIHVTANNVNISSFTIQKGGRGLYDGGIFVDRSGGNNISHNTITNSPDSNGICLSFSVKTTVFGNTVSDNKYGISLYSSNDNKICGNNVSDNKYGIGLYSSNNNEISCNNASSNKINGFHIHSSTDNIISSNTASLNNYDGIRLDFSNNNAISGNTASNNDYGIRLDSSSNNIVSANTASNNYYGIYLHSSSNNNTIHHNNFDNTDQVWSDSVNVWDYDKEGNYWSDYNGTDFFSGPYRNETGSDGIGDTPYNIDENNQDNYPLMGMFSDFNVTLERETYHVTAICNSTISGFRFEIGAETGNKIIRFDVTGEEGAVGFCRVVITTELMNYPYIVLVDGEEITPTLLNASNETHTYLYFTYIHSGHTITIISSKLLYLYNELLDEHVRLQLDFHNLNLTYFELLDNYGALLGNYSQLLESYDSLNTAYEELTGSYSQLLERYSTLNASYQEHLLDYSELLERYGRLNASYQELQGNHTSLLWEHGQNIRNIVYVFIATTTIFIIAAVYLSTHAHRRVLRS